MWGCALRRLLLAGRLSVSTQQPVKLEAKAAPDAAVWALAHWFWLFGTVICALLAWLTGAEAGPVAAAAALAMAPALAGFILLPRFGEPRVDLGYLAVWIVSASGLAAGSGGALTPLSAAFAIAPAAALALGRAWVAEAGAAAVLAYAASAGLAAAWPPDAASLGPFPEILAVAALAFAAGLMALSHGGGAREAALGRRIAEVSHELRTPLTHILGFSEMIERRMFGELSERYGEYAGLIRKSGAHLLDLVNDLLDLSRIEAGRYDLQLERFDVRDVIDEVVRLNTDAAERKSIVLGMVTPDAALVAHADRRALRRILINTIGNAVKFTPEGGRVIVEAAREGALLRLDTSDTGPGIAPEDRERLGRAYERGAGAGSVEGTGLGLALVRALAGLHGGELSFHEAPGGGALVRVSLPVLD